MSHSTSSRGTAQPVRSVTVTFDDGTTRTFDTPTGFYRALSNNVSHGLDHRKTWLEHEVRWDERPRA